MSATHIIANHEIGMTECGRMLQSIPETKRESEDYAKPMPLASSSDVAVWDDVEGPSGAPLCQACWAAYEG